MAKSPSGKTFEVVNVLDLFRKLEWEYDRLREINLSDTGKHRSYIALNAAMTAWHMTHWLCARFEKKHYEKLSSHAGRQIDNCKVFQKWVLEDRAISMCERICVAGKHFDIEENAHAVKTRPKMIEVSKDWPQQNYLMVEDHNSTMPIASVIGFALAFWRMVLVSTGVATPAEVEYPAPGA